jgi:subtilase family serine protease
MSGSGRESGFVVENGIATPGLHKVRAVLDADDDITESDEGNNTATATVVVVE